VDFELKLNPVYDGPLAANVKTVVGLKDIFQNMITPNKYSHINENLTAKEKAVLVITKWKIKLSEGCVFVALIKWSLLFLFI
jgi:hypothetical protein